MAHNTVVVIIATGQMPVTMATVEIPVLMWQKKANAAGMHTCANSAERDLLILPTLYVMFGHTLARSLSLAHTATIGPRLKSMSRDM